VTSPLPRLLFGIAVLSGVRLAAADRSLEVNKAESRIEIRVKATFDSFTGTLADFQTLLVVDSEIKRFFRAKVAFAIADVKTGRAERDRDMAVWSEQGRYPIAEFEMEKIAPESIAGLHTVRGKVTLHGMSQAVEFPISVITDRQQYVIDGQTTIDTRDFGLPLIRKFWFLKVDPIVHIRFHLQAAPLEIPATPPAP